MRCGYSRQGLELLQRCPECGFEPPADEIVLWGFGHGGQRSLENAPPSKFWPALLLANMPWAFFAFQAAKLRHPLAILGTIALAIASNGWLIHSRKRKLLELEAPALAVFNRDGCGQRTGFGDVDLIPWRKIKKVVIGRDGDSLVIECIPKFWSFARANMVDIEIARSDLDEARLHQQLVQWHGLHQEG